MPTIDDIRRKNLAHLVREMGGNKQLADLVGVSESQMNQWVNGAKESKTGKARGMRLVSCHRIEDAAEKPRGWLDERHALEAEAEPVSIISNEAPADGYVRLPILAQAAAGAGRVPPTEFGELVDHVDVAEEWVRRTLRANPATLRVLTAKGHSMAGVIEDGDVMFVEPCTEFERDGLYVIGIDDLLRVKRLRLRVMDRLLSIESNDGSAPETAALHDVGTRVRIHGRVVASWTLRRL